MNANVPKLAAESHSSLTWRLAVGYLLMVLLTLASFMAIRHFGELVRAARGHGSSARRQPDGE